MTTAVLERDLRVLARAGVSAMPLLHEAINRAEVNRFNRDSEALRRRLERQHRRPLERLLASLGGHVAAAAEQAGGLVLETTTEAASAPTQRETARLNAILKLADLPKWRQDQIGPWIEKLYEGAWLGTYSVAQTTLTPAQREKVAKAILREGGRRLGLIDIPGDTKTALFRVLEFAKEFESGSPSPRTVAKWIQSEVPKGRFVNAGSRYRSTLIARTEIMHSTRKAQLETFKADPSVNTVIALDGDEDEDCAARNGGEFTLDDAAIEMDAEHPNGTLSFAPAYKKP